MLHTKSQGPQPSGSEEEEFQWGVIIYRHNGHLGHVIKIICANFDQITVKSLHMNFEFNWPSVLIY